jgi:hypothetical protein
MSQHEAVRIGEYGTIPTTNVLPKTVTRNILIRYDNSGTID